MTDRHAVEITVDICDLATESEADEIREAIESAIAQWKPTVNVTVREY
jgi:hypothetical protein